MRLIRDCARGRDATAYEASRSDRPPLGSGDT